MITPSNALPLALNHPEVHLYCVPGPELLRLGVGLYGNDCLKVHDVLEALSLRFSLAIDCTMARCPCLEADGPPYQWCKGGAPETVLRSVAGGVRRRPLYQNAQGRSG